MARKIPGAVGRTAAEKSGMARPDVDPSDAMLSQVLGTPQLQGVARPTAAPEFDRKRSKHLKYAAAASLAAAAIGAATNTPLAVNLFGGLSQGFSGADIRNQAAHAEQVKAFHDRAFEIDKLNAGVANDQAVLNYQAGVKAGDVQRDLAKMEEDARHAKEMENIQWDRLGSEEERERARADETRRHNEAMEGVARSQAANDSRREDRLAGDVDKPTGRPIAVRGIERQMAAVQAQIDAVKSLPIAEQMAQADRLTQLTKQAGDLAQLRFEVLASMKGADVEQFQQAPAGRPAPTVLMPLPGQGLESLFNQHAPAGGPASGPVKGPVPAPAVSGQGKGKSKFGLDALMQ